jgi:hypothetical protein
MTSEPRPDEEDREAEIGAEVLDAFNARDAIERPGEHDEPMSPADDTDVPPPQ